MKCISFGLYWRGYFSFCHLSLFNIFRELENNIALPKNIFLARIGIVLFHSFCFCSPFLLGFWAQCAQLSISLFWQTRRLLSSRLMFLAVWTQVTYSPAAWKRPRFPLKISSNNKIPQS